MNIGDKVIIGTIVCKNCHYFEADGYLGIAEGQEIPDCVFKIESISQDKVSGLKQVFRKEPKKAKSYDRVLGGFLKYKRLNGDRNCKYFKKKNIFDWISWYLLGFFLS